MRVIAQAFLALLISVGGVQAKTHHHSRHDTHHARSVIRDATQVYSAVKPPRIPSMARVSWYGLRDGSGRWTASGARFNAMALGIAAPPNYPFGMRLRLTSVDTGRTVVATVMDRNGPGVARGGRSYDLFFGTAKALGITQIGVAVVEVRLVEYGGLEAGVEVAEAAPMRRRD